MDFAPIADTITIATSQGLGFAKFLIGQHYFTSSNHVSLSDQSSDKVNSSPVLQISAVIFPVDALAPPQMKSNSCRTATRTLLRRKRRTRRRSHSGGSDDGEDEGFFGDGGGDGPFGRGGGWGGNGWNFNGFGGHDWDGYSSSSSSDPALNFVYEVITWIALSNCVHFAFKKVVRVMADGIGDAERDKVPIRLSAMC